MRSASIYIHIPFCVRKCAYCDFTSYVDRAADFGRYFHAVKREFTSACERYGSREVPSVFFGGGTPTVFPAEHLCALLGAVREAWHILPDAEITAEANPGTVTPETLRALRGAGFNRLSFGAQSFSDALLGTLGRIHTAREIGEAVDMAHGAGFENINLDLMYALPGQSIADWEDTLRRAIALGVPHISCYSLIPEPGTPLVRRIERGELRLPDDDTAVEMQHTAQSILGEAGLLRYEISNYAVPGRESLHNLRYWQRGDYLGLGCAAHSLMDNVRFHNAAGLVDYMDGGWRMEEEPVSADGAVEEALMLETRTVRGIDPAVFRARYGVDLLRVCARSISLLCENGMAVCANGTFALTQRGMDVQDAAVLELLGDLESAAPQQHYDQHPSVSRGISDP